MSITLIAVVSLQCSLTTNTLNEYARELKLPVTVTHEVDLKAHSGFLPVQLREVDTGVETYFYSLSDVLGELPPNEAIDAKNSAVVEFRWGSRAEEAAIANYMAYILGVKCQAILFDTEGGYYISAKTAKEYAQDAARE